MLIWCDGDNSFKVKMFYFNLETKNENLISDFLAIKLSAIIITLKTFNYFQQTGDYYPKFYYFQIKSLSC